MPKSKVRDKVKKKQKIAPVGTNYPIPGIGAWNMLVGFGFVGIGFSLATRWY